ncbi:MAG: hypothetical protein Q9213_005220 [Squamulea squamosa]
MPDGSFDRSRYQSWPTYITAAQFTRKQSPVPVAYVRGSQEYQNYHADTLANWDIREGNTHNSDRAKAVFIDALKGIQEAASNVVQHSVEIATVSVPHHFNDSSKDAVTEAFKEVEPSYRQYWQVIRSVVATRLAYGLHNCEAFGLSRETCNIDDGPHYMIVVEYRETYLQLFIADVAADTCNIISSARYTDLGENAILDVPNTNRVGKMQKLLQNDDLDTTTTTTMNNHYANIQDTLSNFLAKH